MNNNNNAVSAQYIVGEEFALRPVAELAEQQPMFNRRGFDFVNWVDADGKEYSDEATVTVDAATLALSAEWTRHEWTITAVEPEVGEYLVKKYSIEGGSDTTIINTNPISGYLTANEVSFDVSCKILVNTEKYKIVSVTLENDEDVEAVEEDGAFVFRMPDCDVKIAAVEIKEIGTVTYDPGYEIPETDDEPEADEPETEHIPDVSDPPEQDADEV